MSELPGVPRRPDDEKAIGTIAETGHPRGGGPGAAQLRLYIAASTPNSVRAEQNLGATLALLGDPAMDLDVDVVDVFVNGKRAIKDGVIVTPTLVVVHGAQRFMIVGDLSDNSQLRSILTRIVSAAAPS